MRREGREAPEPGPRTAAGFLPSRCSSRSGRTPSPATVTINDDDVFEGTESFSVELSMPAYALLGNVTRATVTVADPEDEPTLQFDGNAFHVSESAGLLSAPVQRKGGSGWAGHAEPHGRAMGEPS